MNVKDLTSDLRLGFRLLFLEPFKRLWAEPGEVTFARNFFGEGLVPTPLSDRATLALASRCIGCGLCDAAGAAGVRPSLLATTYSRASADAPLLGSDLNAFSSEQLVAAEALCPQRVPLVRLHAFLKGRQLAVEGAAAQGADGKSANDV